MKYLWRVDSLVKCILKSLTSYFSESDSDGKEAIC